MKVALRIVGTISFNCLDQYPIALLINTLAYFGIFPKYTLLLYLTFPSFVVVVLFKKACCDRKENRSGRHDYSDLETNHRLINL